MNPSKNQISIFKKLRELAQPHHVYNDQLMAMAIWIDTEYSQKSSVLPSIIIAEQGESTVCESKFSHFYQREYGNAYCESCKKPLT